MENGINVDIKITKSMKMIGSILSVSVWANLIVWDKPTEKVL